MQEERPASAVKKPAGVCKRSLAALQLVSTEEGSLAALEPAATKQTWSGTMYYAATGKLAIRQRFGSKRQVMQFGGLQYARKLLEKIAAETISRLERGMPEERAKQFAESRLPE